MPVYNYTTIDDPFAFGGSATSAIGINAAGQIVGYYGDASGTHGFLLSGGMYTPLDDPSAANQTMASGINNVGQIVGSFQHSSGTTHSFLYNPNGGTYTSVDAVAPDAEALGINDAGQIVGDYRDNTGAIHGFLLINGLHATIDDPLAKSLELGPQRLHHCIGHQQRRPGRRVVRDFGYRQPRLPLQSQRRHLHHPRRSFGGSARHRCVRHQRRGRDRRVLL